MGTRAEPRHTYACTCGKRHIWWSKTAKHIPVRRVDIEKLRRITKPEYVAQWKIDHPWELD